MLRRHRSLVALVCLAALVVALGLPTIGVPPCALTETAATLAGPAVARARPADRSHGRPSSVLCGSALAPRAPPAA
jgi:hypothetical protein